MRTVTTVQERLQQHGNYCRIRVHVTPLRAPQSSQGVVSTSVTICRKSQQRQMPAGTALCGSCSWRHSLKAPVLLVGRVCLPHAEKFVCLWCAACLPHVVVVPVELVHGAGLEEQTPAGQYTWHVSRVSRNRAWYAGGSQHIHAWFQQHHVYYHTWPSCAA